MTVIRGMYMFTSKGWTESFVQFWSALWVCFFFFFFLFFILLTSVFLPDLDLLRGCYHPCFLLSYQKMMTEPFKKLMLNIHPKCFDWGELLPLRKC